MIEMEFRPSSLEERNIFYEKEFSLKKVKQWFAKNKVKIPQICALDAGTDSKIALKKEFINNLYYFPFDELEKQVKKYLPEDVYYDRNVYANEKKVLKELKFGKWRKQEFILDIDSENIKCSCSKVCNSCLKKLYLLAVNIKRELINQGFKKIEIVYSGQGFHVHVFDESAYKLDRKKRKELTNKFLKYPIDPWVSNGEISLVRMPYTLHGNVSRIATPIKNTFIKEKTIPKFMLF